MKDAGKILEFLISVGEITKDDVSRAEHVLETWTNPSANHGRKPIGKAMKKLQARKKSSK